MATQLKEKVISVPDALDRFECEQCHGGYGSKKSLNKHVKLKHSANQIIYKCSVCETKCSEITTIIAHYKNQHKKKISKEVAATLGSLVPNSFLRQSGQKIQMKTVKCICGSIFTSGISSFNKHVRQFHKSLKYSEWIELEEVESSPINDSVSAMKTESGETSSSSIQNLMEPSIDRSLPISQFSRSSEIQSDDIRSKRSLDSTIQTIPTKFCRYELTNTLLQKENGGIQAMEIEGMYQVLYKTYNIFNFHWS